jgi:hypothetical protein
VRNEDPSGGEAENCAGQAGDENVVRNVTMSLDDQALSKVLSTAAIRRGCEMGGELLRARSVEFLGPKFERSKSRAWEPPGLKTWRLPFNGASVNQLRTNALSPRPGARRRLRSPCHPFPPVFSDTPPYVSVTGGRFEGTWSRRGPAKRDTCRPEHN